MKYQKCFLTTLLSLLVFISTSCTQKAPEENLNWKLCIGSYTFKLFTFEEALKKVDSLGVKYIEMATSQKIGAGIEGTTAYTMDEATQKSILDLCSKYNIKILSYGVINGKSEDDWETIFKFAKAMQIPTILSEPKLEELDLVEKLADKYEVNIAIHNHATPTKYWNPDTVAAAINNRSTRIGVCADIGHWVRSGLDPIESIKKLEGRILEFHFKDMNASVIDAHNVVWGTGVVDIKGVMQEIKRQKYEGPFTVEYEYNWENSVPDIRESLKNFRAFVKELE